MTSPPCPVHGSAHCPEDYMLKSDGTPWAHYAAHWDESMRCGRRPPPPIRAGWLHPAYSSTRILSDASRAELESNMADATYECGWLAVYVVPTQDDVPASTCKACLGTGCRLGPNGCNGTQHAFVGCSTCIACGGDGSGQEAHRGE